MARTPTEVLSSLFDRAIYYEFISSIFEQGRIGLLFSTLGAEIQLWEEIIEEYYNQFNLVTATEETAIVNIAAPLYARHPKLPSKVILKFIRSGIITTDIYIPQGTIVETSGANPIQYETTESIYLYDGQEWTKALATSIDYSSDSHVWADELNILVSEIEGLEVTNEEDSWGGADLEPIAQVQTRALGVRPELEHGTTLAVNNSLRDYGLETYQYNLIEHYYNNGSIGVWIDTELDEVLQEIEELLAREKASGVYVVCQKATPLYVPFSIEVDLSLEHDILPQQRDRLKMDVQYYFTQYVEQNGVGQNLILKKAVHYMIEQLIEDYEIYDMDIESNAFNTRQDEYGDIEVSAFEVIKPESVLITIKV